MLYRLQDSAGREVVRADVTAGFVFGTQLTLGDVVVTDAVRDVVIGAAVREIVARCSD